MEFFLSQNLEICLLMKLNQEEYIVSLTHLVCNNYLPSYMPHCTSWKLAMHLLEVSHTMLVLIPDKIYCYARTAFSGEVVVFIRFPLHCLFSHCAIPNKMKGNF